MLATEIPAGLIDAINDRDLLALAALADHFGEQGDDVAEEAIRWCIDNRRITENWTSVKYWRKLSHLNDREGYFLPSVLFQAIPPGETSRELMFRYRDFNTRYEAYIGMVEGWRRLTPLERQQVKEMRL